VVGEIGKILPVERNNEKRNNEKRNNEKRNNDQGIMIKE
jgi:hypothetical protein